MQNSLNYFNATNPKVIGLLIDQDKSIRNNVLKLKSVRKTMIWNKPYRDKCVQTDDVHGLRTIYHDIFFGKISECKIYTGVQSVADLESNNTKSTGEHIFPSFGMAPYFYDNVNNWSEEKFLKNALPLCLVSKTTSQQNTDLSNQKNVLILDKYEVANIECYFCDEYSSQIGLPKCIKDLLPIELIEYDRKNIKKGVDIW